MDEIKKWFVVCSLPGQQKKVAEFLNRRNIENYFPVNRVGGYTDETEKFLHFEPLFSSWTFVRVTENELSGLRQINGVINILYCFDKPAVVSDLEIEKIKLFIEEHRNITLQKMDIQIPIPESEAADESLLDLESIAGDQYEKIVLPSLGYAMCAHVKKSNRQVLVHSKSVFTNTKERSPILFLRMVFSQFQ